jgi:hypothetical protein
MPFDLEKLASFCIDRIREFASRHSDEIFYAFAIDANLLCMNSEEMAEIILAKYRKDWEHIHRQIRNLSELTDLDWLGTETLLEVSAEFNDLDTSDEDACVELINRTREESRKNGNPYLLPDNIKSLRENTGDWEYQGFAVMTDEVGFDRQAYQEHYDMCDEEQPCSDYAIAMDELLKCLKEMGAFDSLNKTAEFIATRVEHNY